MRFSLFLLTLICCCARADKPFLALSLDAARERAQTENKLVFIDFFTTWCAPCKMMDRGTWKEPEVIAWLKEHTIPLKIDAEAEIALANKYRVRAYPTLLFLKPDGSELDRMMGYQEKNAFLKMAKNILAGKTILSMAAEELEREGSDHPMARMKYARTLAQKQMYAEAWGHYRWCYEEGVAANPAFVGVHGSFLLNDMIDLGRVHPPAQAYFRQRLDQLRQALLSGKASKRQAHQLGTLQQAFGNGERAVALIDEIIQRDPEMPLLDALIRPNWEYLLAQKRFALLEEYLDIPAEAQRALALHRMSTTRQVTTPPGMDMADLQDMRTRITLNQLGKYYRILIAVKQAEAAAEVAASLLQLKNDARAFNVLAWNGFLSGAPLEVNVAQGRKAYELSEGKDAMMVNTLARLLHARGAGEEARALVGKALAADPSGKQRAILERCRDDLAKP